MALAAGLLTKAYFLPMIPFVVALVIVRRGVRDALLCTVIAMVPAVPLYVRNVLLYHDLGGQQENMGGHRRVR